MDIDAGDLCFEGDVQEVDISSLPIYVEDGVACDSSEVGLDLGIQHEEVAIECDNSDKFSCVEIDHNYLNKATSVSKLKGDQKNENDKKKDENEDKEKGKKRKEKVTRLYNGRKYYSKKCTELKKTREVKT